jgi:hypothetical protein
VQLLLSSSLALSLACVAKPPGGPAGETAEPFGAEPVVFVEVPPEPTRVEPEPSEPPLAETLDADQRDEAKRLFQAAVQLYEAGDIAAAVVKFREAYALAPLPAVLFNIARGQEQLGDVVGACESYRRAHTDPLADDSMRDAASKQRAQLNCP